LRFENNPHDVSPIIPPNKIVSEIVTLRLFCAKNAIPIPENTEIIGKKRLFNFNAIFIVSTKPTVIAINVIVSYVMLYIILFYFSL